MINCKKHFINSFNIGILSIEYAELYFKNGYAIICSNGKVSNIIKDEM